MAEQVNPYEQSSDEHLAQSLDAELQGVDLTQQQTLLLRELIRRMSWYNSNNQRLEAQQQEMQNQQQQLHQQQENVGTLVGQVESLTKNLELMQLQISHFSDMADRYRDEAAFARESLQTAQATAQQAQQALAQQAQIAVQANQQAQNSIQNNNGQQQAQGNQNNSTSGGNNGGQQQTQPVVSLLKPEKPHKFDGDGRKLNNWLFAVESYCLAMNVRNAVDVASFAVTLLEKRALTWWRTCLSTGLAQIGTTGWFELKAGLQNEFWDPDHDYQQKRRLHNLKQTKSVASYVQQFRDCLIDMGTKAPGADYQLHLFVEGLKPEVQRQVLMANPADLSQAIFMASRVDTVHHNFSSRQQQSQPMELGQVGKQKQQGGSKTPTKHVTNTTKGKTSVECWYCGKQGHVEAQCYKKQRDIGKPGQTPKKGQRGKTPFNKRGKKLYNTCIDSGNDSSGCESDSSESKN